MLLAAIGSLIIGQVPPRRADPPMPQPPASDVPMGHPQPAPAPVQPTPEPAPAPVAPAPVPAPPVAPPDDVTPSADSAGAMPAATPDPAAPAPTTEPVATTPTAIDPVAEPTTPAAPAREYAIDGAARIARSRWVAPTEPAAKPDRLRVRVPADQVDSLTAGPTSGRVLVFFAAVGAPIEGDPADGPFFEAPQPLAGMNATDITAGIPLELGEGTDWYPFAMQDLEGEFVMQALLDRDSTVSGHKAPGNLIGTPQTVRLSRDTEDDVELELGGLIPADAPNEGAVGDDPDRPQLVWINHPSALVTESGRPAVHRAAVILPPGYHDTTHARRVWPTVYVVPGFGGRHTAALGLMKMVHSEIGEMALPPAVWVVLDPESPLGHHGFVDSVANGPRGTALTSELIPMLESRFRLEPVADSRLVTGHSSGGWSSMWLALTYPETFGACFSSSPDPVDFSAFQCLDLYRDANAYDTADGAEIPSFREPMRDAYDRISMNDRDEIMTEWVLSPEGASGEQWDAWSAMWSPVSSTTGVPRRLVDPATGAIDPIVVEAWSTFDLTRRLRENPTRYAPLWRDRVHLLCGDRDNFFLERAVARAKEAVAALPDAGGPPADPARVPGYIELIPRADHGSAAALAALRFYPEMRRWIDSHPAPVAADQP